MIELILPSTQPSLETLRSLVNQHWAQLEPALDCGVSEFDTHSQYTRSEFDHIDLEANTVVIHYKTHYHVYHPCRGMDLHDFCRRFVRGQLNGTRLQLAIYQAPDERSTADEL
ncbi:hypothetical protein HZU75_15185 [Chitinibacter fontanus]|uniref:Uncharacterized protein n=1 Tax=Chitinibacter fontanus TaxID=1737446 RepID=A0A7D5VBE4_9NEIS|nr:hypothetical protein [Chitinibacter fontanus]QLI82755.1 hypothetical protein HZU75_15185 [Chitinibacter fontanus]